jgi:3-oxoacyl-[acyl-carrier-protein] synthase III
MARILNIDYYLPEKVESNADLASEFVDFDNKLVSEKLGINQRHIASKDETALDMATHAAERVLENYDRDKIDFILLCTQSPEYYLPSGSCILQDKLNLGNNVGAFDFNLGCSGFVYGLGIARSFITSGMAKNVLLITSDTYSKYIHNKDRSNRSIFGDGAAACLIENGENDFLGQFVWGTDGKGYDKLIVRNGATKNRFDNHAIEKKSGSTNIYTDNNLFMSGVDVFNFTIEQVPKVVEEALSINNCKVDDLKYIIYHQANDYMLTYLRKKQELPPEKFYMNIKETGNTVSSSIPLALSDLVNAGKIERGDKVLLVGFGVGLSWGATVLTY